jgi:ribosomal protein RSM22 (predicted rRNA methylase)
MLKKAALELSERYRKGITPYLRTPQDRQAYLLTRFPATQTVIKRVFQEIAHLTPKTILDIGAGPGTSWGAITETWGEGIQATFVERDRDFVAIGRTLTPHNRVRWVTEKASTFAPHDLVLFSYSWGEIDDIAVLKSAWQTTQIALIVIEPGTPRGYEKMLKARTHCIESGGFVLAPCPHSNKCPWQGTTNWCHFGVRLQRSEGHRLAKKATLGYEDEKYSYTILVKQTVDINFERLLKDPLRRKGHTILTLCTKDGISEKTISKSQDNYKSINKLKWGDKV